MVAPTLTDLLPASPTKPNKMGQSGSAAAFKVPDHIIKAVSEASGRGGVSFTYLMHKAAAESSFNPTVKAKTSSATGLYQFIDRTWLDMVDRHGARYGLSDYANAIKRKADGTPVVADKAVRKEILELRKDPRMAALMAAEFAGENKAQLQKALGRDVNDTELYLAHFLGAGGATKFLKAMDLNPSAKAASFLPEAAAANESVFYNKQGGARSLQAIYDRFAAKFDDAQVYEPTEAIEDGVTPAAPFTPPRGQQIWVHNIEGQDGVGLADTTRRLASFQQGSHSGAETPFLTTYMLAALEMPAEAEQKALGAQAAYSKAAAGLGPAAASLRSLI